MKHLKIRKAKASELKTIQNLNYALFQSDKHRDEFLNLNWPYKEGKKVFEKMIKGGNNLCLVAELKGEVIGYLAGSICKIESWRPIKRAELENMFVKEKYRSKGVGSKLVKEFFKWSKSKGAKRAMVQAYSTNAKAIKFYKKTGFDPFSLSQEVEIE
jgi:ribosomal protein S18 acetylase RimI-like enzyme